MVAVRPRRWEASRYSGVMKAPHEFQGTKGEIAVPAAAAARDREPSEFLLEPANLDLERQNTLKNSIPEKGLCIVK
jgi:hypothetical protein